MRRNQMVTSRRRFLAAPSLLGAPAVLRAQSRRARPNVLYIVTDDQRWDLLSLRGHAFLRTPNMDRIGLVGAVFTSAFVTTSLCAAPAGRRT